MRNLALYFMEGEYGCPIDTYEALRRLFQAVDKQCPNASHDLAVFYTNGDLGLCQDMKKAREYYETAAMGGNPFSHANLGSLEAKSGNFALAIRHWRIAAASGLKLCVEKLDVFCEMGLISKNEVDETKRAWRKASEEMWSEDRDVHVKLMEENDKSFDYIMFEYAIGIGGE